MLILSRLSAEVFTVGLLLVLQCLLTYYYVFNIYISYLRDSNSNIYLYSRQFNSYIKPMVTYWPSVTNCFSADQKLKLDGIQFLISLHIVWNQNYKLIRWKNFCQFLYYYNIMIFSNFFRSLSVFCPKSVLLINHFFIYFFN